MKFTIENFKKEYPNEDACLEAIFVMKYPKGSLCPVCQDKDSYEKIHNRKGYQCGKCRNQIYPMVGTVYQKSTTSLLLWFYANFLFIKSKNGLTSMELQRHIGVTYKTAYRMLKVIRLSLKQKESLMFGTLEVDETFVGGLNKNRHHNKKIPNSQGRSIKDKTPVFGIYERDTRKVRAYVVKDTSKESIQPIIFEYSDINAHIMSDEWKGYNGLYRYYVHSRINHKKKEYVRDDVTTNRIENFWSNYKRYIKGSYIHVTRKHLQMYVNESVFIYNNRDNSNIFQTLLTYCLLLK